MTLNEFIQKYNGVGIDYDHVYSNQCVDLINQFCVEVLGIKNPIQVLPGATAIEIYNNYNGDEFEKIANTPDNVPTPGDIIFWKPNVKGVTGPAGHVAIFLQGDQNNFTSLDQNYPTGSLVHEQSHDYTGVAGWLHFKGGAVTQLTQDTLDSLRMARDNNWNLYQTELQKNTDLSKQVADLEQEKARSDQKLADFITEIQKALALT